MKGAGSPVINFLVVLAIGALVLVVIGMIFGFISVSARPAESRIDKEIKCGEWINKRCDILSPAYTELQDAGICQPCDVDTEGMTAEEKEAAMLAACGDIWNACKAICNCPI